MAKLSFRFNYRCFKGSSRFNYRCFKGSSRFNYRCFKGSSRFKLLWFLGISFVCFGVFNSLKYTSTARPVPKIKLSFSQDLQEIGRYNYLRLWPELGHSPVVLGVNTHLDLASQVDLWRGFLSEAEQRGKVYPVTVDRSLLKVFPQIKEFLGVFQVVEHFDQWLQESPQGRRAFLTFSKNVISMQEKLSKDNKVLALWPLTQDRDFLKGQEWPYPCLDDLKSVNCEIYYKSLSTLRRLQKKIRRLGSKTKNSKGWFHTTDRINRFRYNIYLYKN